MRHPKTEKITPYHIEGDSEIQLISMDRIRVINPRSRNKKIFARLVENIASIGLKRPVTVTKFSKDASNPCYDLICGQGRYEAFQMLGEKEIPCIVVNASETDRFLVSLVENLARRKHSNHDLLEAIRVLEDMGYSNSKIAEKTGLDPMYITCSIQLLRQGEERIIEAVEQGWLSIAMASKIATSGNEDVQNAMVQAYEEGTLNGEQLMRVRRLIAQRNTTGKGYGKWKNRADKNITAQKLLKTYQKDVRRQKLMIKKAEVNDQRQLFIVSAINRFLEDEHFYTLLRAEGLLDMPKILAERIREISS